jgi:fibrobacter succinogenes major domain (fib_succ_major)
LPTDEDWKKLETELYMDGDELGLLEQWRGKQAGMLLKEEGTGFRILYGGTRAYGTFAYGTPYMNKDMNAYFWSSSKIVQSDSVQTGIIRAASKVYEGILRGTSNLTAAYSVRCIKE